MIKKELLSNSDKTHLGPEMIQEFIEKAELNLGKIDPEVYPLRALFNLIVALNEKIDDLNQELNKTFKSEIPIKEH